MRGTLVATLLLLAGCDKLFDLHHFGDSPSDGDGGLDGPAPDSDATEDMTCFGTGRGFRMPFCFTPAEIAMFPATLTLNSPVNTNQTCPRAVAQSSGPDLCVFTAGTITISSNIRFVGDKAIVLLAKDAIVVDRDLDVSSSWALLAAGAGGDSPGCIMSVLNGNPGAVGGGGGGGAGGSFVGQGGRGGNGSLPGNSMTSALGGSSLSGTTPLVIRGGCRGGAGGAGTMAGRLGGHGGGAIYLVAGASITVAASINAFGAGGLGGVSSYVGGSGGGAGGMIVLDAPSVTTGTGTILNAIGGTGGEGGDDNGSGATGADGASAAPTSTGAGGDGGAGSGSDASTGEPGAPGGGGGGGGGGGYIGVFSLSRTLLGQSFPSATIP
jgi:hypothetical protein